MGVGILGSASCGRTKILLNHHDPKFTDGVLETEGGFSAPDRLATRRTSMQGSRLFVPLLLCHPHTKPTRRAHIPEIPAHKSRICLFKAAKFLQKQQAALCLETDEMDTRLEGRSQLSS